MATLHHHRVTAPGATPDRWLLLLHGIYGAGRNWNRVARDFVLRRPEWGVIPTDLRGHGRSPLGEAPHTLDACVNDLLELIDHLRLPISAVLGHSFGGKVALLLGDRPEAGIEDVVVVDSTPDPRPPSGSAWTMLRLFSEAPGPFADRAEGIAAVESLGFENPVAQWMATNLSPDASGQLAWRLDPLQMKDLLESFFERDAWPVLESAAGPKIHMLKATESSLLDSEARERLEEIRGLTDRVQLHEIAGGHWLNADNPGAVVEILASEL